MAQAEPARFKPVWKQVVADYRANLAAEGVVGSSVVIVHDGRIVGADYEGLADKATGSRVDENTLFHWASITKLFTEIAIMQLRDRGKLSLDDRIIDYLPEVKQVHNPYGPMSAITLRHLITHSSGLRARTFPWRDDDKDWQPLEPNKWSQVAAMMPYSEVEFAPGSRYGYSNPGASMLGRVVEEITGETLQAYVIKNILMPLGMNHTYYESTPYFLQPYRSHSYLLEKGKLQDLGGEVPTGATTGNGGLNGTLSDMVKFSNFLLGIGDNGTYDTVLNRKTLQDMWQPGFEVPDNNKGDGLSEKMGLGFFILDQEYNNKNLHFVGHTGGQMAFTAMVYVYPEGRAAVVAAFNTLSEKPTMESVFGKTRRDVFTKILPLFTPASRVRKN